VPLTPILDCPNNSQDNYEGPDEFVYEIKDSGDLTATATGKN